MLAIAIFTCSGFARFACSDSLVSLYDVSFNVVSFLPLALRCIKVFIIKFSF